MSEQQEHVCKVRKDNITAWCRNYIIEEYDYKHYASFIANNFTWACPEVKRAKDLIK